MTTLRTLIAAVLVSAPLVGLAQEAEPKEEEKPAETEDAVEAADQVTADYSFEDDDLVIVGEVQKPEVTVVISRENLNKSYHLELKESFLPKIVDSVDRAPF